MTRLYEVWITTDEGSMTTTVVTIEAQSERDAHRKAKEQHPGQVVRGVLAVGEDD